MRYRLILIFTTTAYNGGSSVNISTQLVDEVYSCETDAIEAGYAFKNNLSGSAECKVGFSAFPGN